MKLSRLALSLCLFASLAQAAPPGAAPVASAANAAAAPAQPATTSTAPAPARPMPGDKPHSTTAAGPQVPLPPPSSAAQKLYSLAKGDLLQVRSLLRGAGTQSSVGSGFLIGTGDLVVTNYHVVSQFALDPETYVGEWVDTSGKHGTVELLAIDVLHDLAVVRVNRRGTGFFRMPATLATLTQGQYLYSLGNPLDLGFAISEGAYNGVISRSFYDQLMFTGPINSGMSGGPSVTVDGDVAGINVSKRLDGELVSFLVPARYALALLDKVAHQTTAPKDFKPLVAQQLLAHQNTMVSRLLDQPLPLKAMGPYLVPVPESEQMRCWGNSEAKPEIPYVVDSTNCAMESAIFISEALQTGAISMRHEYLRSTRLDAMRFAVLATASFRNEHFGNRRDTRLTSPVCTEQFVKNRSVPLRALLCVRAYRKFAGLYDIALLTASTDNGLVSLQSRLDAKGVSYENGMRAARQFLDALQLPPAPARRAAPVVAALPGGQP